MYAYVPDISVHQTRVRECAPLARAERTKYCLVNGTFACENDKVLNGLLKGELGYQGCMSSSGLLSRIRLTCSSDVMSGRI